MRTSVGLASLAVLLLAGASDAVRLSGQAVTWADFSHVNDITASFRHVYFATTEGIISYNTMEDRWDDPLTGSEGLLDMDIRRIWVDRFDDHLYAETVIGLWEYDSHLDRWYGISDLPLVDNDVAQVSVPKILHPPAGYVYWEDGRLEDRIDRGFYVTKIIDNRTGTWYMALWGLGPARVDANSGVIDLMSYGLLQNRVNALIKRGDRLWLSGAVFTSDRTGITIFDVERRSFSYIESGLYPGFPAVDVNCLEVDDSILYVGTPVGLFLVDLESRRVRQELDFSDGLPDNNVISLKRLGDMLFVGTASGLSAVSFGDSLRYVRPGRFVDQVVYDLEEVDSTLWIASSAGAFRLKLQSGRLQEFRDPDNVLFGDVYDIAPYSTDIWFLADDGAVRLDAETGESEPFWLGARRVRPRALAVNDSIAAIGTDKGVTIIYYRHPKQITRNFTVEDGLASNNVFSLVSDGDYLWIGTDEGLTRFLWNNPERID